MNGTVLILYQNLPQKPYQVAFCLLLCLIFIGVAYAVVGYTLSINGYVSLNGSVKLEIVDQNILNVRPGEEAIYPTGYTSSRDVIQMSLYMVQPGDSRTIQFYLRNTGSAPAVLGDWETTLPPIEESGLEFSYPDLRYVVVLPGTTVGPFNITVHWDIAHYDVLGGTRRFDAWIGYHL